MRGIIKKIFIVLLSSIVNASNHTKCVLLNNQECMTQLTLIYILMNTVKNYTTIDLQLSYIDVLEVIILLMTYLIKYVFKIPNKTGHLNLSVFNMITGIMN